MPGLLEGKVAVVSGVGPGMGRDLSLACAREGSDVVLAARSDWKLEAVAREVEELGRTALSVPSDVSDPEQCRRLAEAATAAFGGVDVLINNAFKEDPFVDFQHGGPDVWRDVFDVNFFGTLQVTQAFVPSMKTRGGGAIVMISTLSTRIVNPLLGGYASSKAALLTASKTLAEELGPAGIRVNSIAPGHIWGRSLEWYFDHLAKERGVTPQQIYDEIADQTCLKRIHTSAEIAEVVLFFASDRSRAITGQTLDVNGGRYFH